MYERPVTLESVEHTGKRTYTARYSLEWRESPTIRTMTLHLDDGANVISVEQHDD